VVRDDEKVVAFAISVLIIKDAFSLFLVSAGSAAFLDVAF